MAKFKVNHLIEKLHRFTGYYSKFFKNYTSIVKLLINMLKKNEFTWSIETEKAFEKLKKAMTTTPLLAMLSFDKVFEIHSDASNIEVVSVLTQERRLLANISKALSIQKKW